ncbi:MAG: toll/interleukin-1 receptor domain-containing protein [Hyphomonadaceae bacterium]|nr:toll/interleukin-1 receptor domain-containing protein [Hyphomonadaceae bacterium]
MTDVFISYKRDERDKARQLAEALGARGFSVWWDAEILPGEQYRAVTLQILESCRAAIVIWSPLSAKSNWVLDEAQRALDRGVLVPVHLEPISSYPLGFGQVHAHNLVGWEGAPDDPKFQPVLAAVERLAGAQGKQATGQTSAGEAEAQIAFWRGIQDSAKASDFETYLARYGRDGLFSGLAQERLAALRPRAAFAQGAPSPVAGLRPPLTRWELGFIALCLAVAGLALWPLANLMTGNQMFFDGDYTTMFMLGYPQNLFVMTPLLTGAAWLFDRAAAWCETRGRPVSFAPLALPPGVLCALYLVALRGRDQSYDDNAYVVAAELTHLYLWIAAAWGLALVARGLTPAFKRVLQSIGVFR